MSAQDRAISLDSVTKRSTAPFISFFDLFKIGLGPSSSHTVGPMKAARIFLEELKRDSIFQQVQKLQASLYGSLALTGIGHGTDRAILAGLSGRTPESIDPAELEPLVQSIKDSLQISLLDELKISFDPKQDLIWHRNQNLPRHPNGMKFTALSSDGQILREKNYYSIGGGFIVDDQADDQVPAGEARPLPFPFQTGEDLLRMGKESGLQMWQMVLENEKTLRTEDEVRAGVWKIWQVMRGCIDRGFQQGGNLPGGMKVRRRAPELVKLLKKDSQDPLRILDWVNAAAIAVNEENASFGRVVTAPTNGAAGILPAVAFYVEGFLPHSTEDHLFRFFLTASAIGTLYKINASISGAEVGCQGEVGVASSMAAGALAEVLGGTNEQIENAAEIAMEHHLGMTCDPVGGLVQIPCIERNAMGAVKALNAARMSMQGDGQHAISLDRVIKTMWETGQDMSTKYKETSRGGLAMNVPEC